MLYGDLGRFPLSICIKKGIIHVGFCYKLCHNHCTLSLLLYKCIVNDITNNGKTYHWFENVRSVLYECNLGHVWESQHFSGSRSTLLSFVEHMLKTNYIATWKNDVYISPKCINYRIFKTQHELESYLCNLPEKYVNCLVNYRMCNNRLPMETGRWVGLERNQRVCNLNNNEIIIIIIIMVILGTSSITYLYAHISLLNVNTILASQTLWMLTL